MDFKLYILPGKFVPTGLERQYHATYHTFKTVWSSTFAEVLHERRKLTSDDFTRQDYVQALFNGTVCVGVDMVRTIDLNNPVDHQDSWFRNWNPKHLTDLQSQGFGPCLINSYFTVHEDYRRTVIGADQSVGYLLGCLSVLHQLELRYSLMLGMMRNNRSMDKMGKLWGSSTIEAAILHNDIPTDLVAFHEPAVRTAARQFPKYVMDIFNNKTNFFERNKNERAA